VLGNVLDAHEAKQLCIFNRVLATSLFEQEVTGFAAAVAQQSASAVRLIKRLLYDTDGATFEQAIRRGMEVNTIARMTPNCREGVQKFLASRKKK
ncbi:MAG: hypothetical protein ACREMA_14295, partial [Longimicrobiales bacterium]